MRHNLLLPEKDYMFDSAIRFRRNTMKNGDTEPIVQHQSEFLRRGGGNGGSPTNFESKAHGGTLVPQMRVAKAPLMRVRDRQGGYDYAGSSMDRGSQGSPGRERSLSPGQKAEVEKRKRVQ